MAVSGISSLGLGQETFLQLLVAQVQNQNPLDPLSDTDFIAQVAQFSTLESLQQLNANFSEMLLLQQLTQGSNLLGQTIQFDSDEAGLQEGVVNSVNVQNGNIFLALSGGGSVALNQITSVLGTP